MLTVNRVERIQGRIQVPGDKSISHRAVMFASIAKGKSTIEGFLPGEDCLSTVACCRGLGIDIKQEGTFLEVQGKGQYGLQEPENLLDAGNSGTTMRLLSGILAGQSFLSVITGDGSLRKRPMARIANPLRQMGAKIDGRVGGKLAPLIIRGGNLEGIDYTLPVPSAQVKSAILLAGLYASGETIVREEFLSRDHTERMLQFFGGNLERRDGSVVLKKSELYGQSVKVPGDISSAAFFMAAAAAMPGGHLIIEDVGLNPTRTGIIDVLREMGAHIRIDNIYSSGGEDLGTVIVEGGKLKGITITKEIMPRLIDEVPVIAAISALAEGTMRITGAEELKVKESNRIAAMVTELKKLGIQAEELEDGMEITGTGRISGGVVESYGDHRIAMAMAVCGLFAQEPVQIQNSECIAVSFPGFEKTLKEITW
ncbi:3-phosphoshikimate 1-carboxyvinyltransferase [Geosporobacter ferrireducens]|uniref:3-phosphoshikimate 1-carboxyvinyltransferase n=2 Tax=Geosporobacter ferrireducens TaxID=1424294 RepID=A0A1D8GQ83_9FIRM|nr:3-phosphoshikimate 1-carboxyvinyltransferase [Geosporobacter ferrireducens]AOT73112.1 3-phosphoshikimate 1-carboxyvinyltransferase [Geosporobacter ferrireducens]MTI57164.1 3-phosphoshikimate 1-carboxyvinyltransferase [Geosporobacter ferrireducens]